MIYECKGQKSFCFQFPVTCFQHHCCAWLAPAAPVHSYYSNGVIFATVKVSQIARVGTVRNACVIVAIVCGCFGYKCLRPCYLRPGDNVVLAR